VEWSGSKSRALQIAQTSTQFVGVANACEFFCMWFGGWEMGDGADVVLVVYGYNGRIIGLAMPWWKRRFITSRKRIEESTSKS